MEGEKNDCSTFSVPGTLSDLTIMSTPLPQAASTATKRRTTMEDVFSEYDDMVQSAYNKTDHQFRVPKLPPHKTSVPIVKSPSKTNNEKKNIHSTDPTRNKSANSSSALDDRTNCIKMGSEPMYNTIGVDSKSGIKPLKPSTEHNKPKSPRKLSRSSYTNNIAADRLEVPAGLTRYTSTRDLNKHHEDRASVATSANSSLGLISNSALDESFSQPLVDVNQDLSFKLAQKLNLDTSLLRDGMDFSSLASERYKERLAPNYEDKENQRCSSRSSSNSWTLHGYSSDRSDSKNHTAKRLSSLSMGSDREFKSPKKSPSSARHSLQQLTELNSPPSKSKSRSGRSSLDSNPFSGYSNVSVNSDDFNFCEDASKVLERDQRQFSIANSRSLSGIYGDPSVSVNVDGEKMSMSSFLRSGSYPLGSLETGANDPHPPQFGLPSRSPVKTGKPKPILPPPLDRSTFVLEEEEPVRDIPWAPQSLVEQFSNIHEGDVSYGEVSVPSISYIDQVLNKLHQGADHMDLLAQLMDSKGKSKNKPEKAMKPNRISSIVEGETSFCQGQGPQHRSYEVSQAESFCNITDFEGDEEVCVCVLTFQSMDFDVFNELSHPVEYRFTKACYRDGQRNDSAAYVNFPVSKLMLYPDQKRTLTINIAPLMAGVIKIKIEISRRNPLTQVVESSTVYGKIVAEIPKVSLMTNNEAEMVPNPACDYDGKYQHVIVMKNEGRSVVPLKLTLSKLVDDDIEFHFGEREKHQVIVSVEPGKLTRQLVQCETPPVFAHLQSPDSIIPVTARVEFCLPTTELHQLSPIPPISLVAPIKPYFFGAPPTLVVPNILSLYNGCDRPVMFKTKTAVGYAVCPPTFTIPPNLTFAASVMKAEVRNPQRRGELILGAAYPEGKMSQYQIKLEEGRRSSHSSLSSLATPHSSRATSPTSPSNRLPVEDLNIACSHNQLVWGGCHLHQRVVRSFCLKNVGRQREKLRLTMSKPCFTIVGDDDSPRSEVKLSLQPMENREVKVAVLATAAGPLWGHLTISRISCAADKNLLPLFAFGGKPKVLLDGVFEVEGKKYLFLDDNFNVEGVLEGSFTLTNSGDNTAFFKISEAYSKSSPGISISPQESVLDAGHNLIIRVCLSITTERLEYLLRQSGASVSVAQLNVCWGDESTRQRLLLMRGLEGVLANRVSQLSHIPSRHIPDLDNIASAVSGAEGLWEEDTDEWSVKVLVKRTALEALRLDTCKALVQLDKTMSKPHH